MKLTIKRQGREREGTWQTEKFPLSFSADSFFVCLRRFVSIIIEIKIELTDAIGVLDVHLCTLCIIVQRINMKREREK